METVTKNKLYEAMFLVDSADAGSDWDGIIATITKILKRAKVEIISIKKWDDRKLVYDIRGKSRGTYLLCYFRSDGQTNHEIEKDVQLSERIIRVLILSADWLTEEDIERDTPATKAEKEKEHRETAKETADETESEADTSEEDESSEAEDEDEEADSDETTDDEEDDAASEEDVDESQTVDPAEEETDDWEQTEPKTGAGD